MPAGDGTGPEGRGQMTGRKMGFCSGNNRPGFAEPGFKGAEFRRGSGFGAGRGLRSRRAFGTRKGFDRGFGFQGFGSMSQEVYERDVELEGSPEQEKKYLKREIEDLEEEKQQMEKRLKELESSKENSN